MSSFDSVFDGSCFGLCFGFLRLCLVFDLGSDFRFSSIWIGSSNEWFVFNGDFVWFHTRQEKELIGRSLMVQIAGRSDFVLVGFSLRQGTDLICSVLMVSRFQSVLGRSNLDLSIFSRNHEWFSKRQEEVSVDLTLMEKVLNGFFGVRIFSFGSGILWFGFRQYELGSVLIEKETDEVNGMVKTESMAMSNVDFDCDDLLEINVGVEGAVQVEEVGKETDLGSEVDNGLAAAKSHKLKGGTALKILGMIVQWTSERKEEDMSKLSILVSWMSQFEGMFWLREEATVEVSGKIVLKCRGFTKLVDSNWITRKKGDLFQSEIKSLYSRFYSFGDLQIWLDVFLVLGEKDYNFLFFNAGEDEVSEGNNPTYHGMEKGLTGGGKPPKHKVDK